MESSVRYVREYVHAYLSDTLSEARGHIQEYADSFNHTMQAALATQQQGTQLIVSPDMFTVSALKLHHGCCLHDQW